MTTDGPVQLLSLRWALAAVQESGEEPAKDQLARVLGWSGTTWDQHIARGRWSLSNAQVEQLTKAWNDEHPWGRRTGRHLDENAWLSPLYHLWLRTPKMVLAANLEYLCAQRSRGVKAWLAEQLHMPPSTVARWAHWQRDGEDVRCPPRTKHDVLKTVFGLSPNTDLLADPLFLGRDAMRDDLVRAHAEHLLGKLSGKALQAEVLRLQERVETYVDHG